MLWKRKTVGIGNGFKVVGGMSEWRSCRVSVRGFLEQEEGSVRSHGDGHVQEHFSKSVDLYIRGSDFSADRHCKIT